MADNVEANAGSGGPVFATDDIGGVQHPRVKVGHGADGSYTDASDTAPMPTKNVPQTSGGLSVSRTLSAASTNLTVVKGSAGMLYGLIVTNINAAVRYLKIYNKASAPTLASDTPAMTLAIPGNTAGAGMSVNIPVGIAFSAGIAFALTTGIDDTDTGAVAANELIVNALYK